MTDSHEVLQVLKSQEDGTGDKGVRPPQVNKRSSCLMATTAFGGSTGDDSGNSSRGAPSSDDYSDAYYSSSASSTSSSARSTTSNRSGCCSTRTDSITADGWLTSRTYAVVPNTSFVRPRGERQLAAGRRGSDYQDVWKLASCASAAVAPVNTDMTGAGRPADEFDSGSLTRVPPKSFERLPAPADEDCSALRCTMGSASSTNGHEATSAAAMGCCHPPKLAPVSGCLVKSTVDGVVRPIAFKPASGPSRLDDDSLRQGNVKQPSTLLKMSGDEGYVSREESHRCRLDSFRLTPSGERPRQRSPSRLLLSSRIDESSSVSPYSLSRSSTAVSTGSPATTQGTGALPAQAASDSCLAELELALREKESEIASLRETMERNEKVIFAVCEERRAAWQKQVRDLAAEYQRRLRLQQDRSCEVESSLKTQIQQAQNEGRQLFSEVERLTQELESTGRLHGQLNTCKLKCEELDSELTIKCAELVQAQQTLYESAGSTRCLNAENATLRTEMTNMQTALEEKTRDVEKLKDSAKLSLNFSRSSRVNKVNSCEIGKHVMSSSQMDDSSVLRLEINRLRSELERRNHELKSERESIENERILWQNEKDKVIQYQKQLQINYMQMYRKNAQLERDLGELLQKGCLSLEHASDSRDNCATLSLLDKPESMC